MAHDILQTLDRFYQAFAISFSGATYLLNFVTSITAGIDYYHYVRKHPSRSWIFFGFVAVIVISQAFVPYLFSHAFQEPFTTSCFYPLLQLRRLLQALSATFLRRGPRIEALQSDERSTLYSFVVAALETSPHLQLQVSYFFMDYNEARRSNKIVLAIIASFLSGTVQGAMCGAATTCRPTARFQQKIATVIAAGLFTSSVIVMRSVGVLAMTVWTGLILHLGVYLVTIFAVCLVYMTRIRPNQAPGNGYLSSRARWVIQSVGWTAAGTSLGLIYPMACYAKSRNELGRRVHWIRLLVASGAILCAQIVIYVICLPAHPRWTPRCCTGSGSSLIQAWQIPCCFYTPAIVTAIAVYVLSLAWYINLDANMGPMEGSEPEVRLSSRVHSENKSDDPMRVYELLAIEGKRFVSRVSVPFLHSPVCDLLPSISVSHSPQNPP